MIVSDCEIVFFGYEIIEFGGLFVDYVLGIVFENDN